MSDPVPLVDYLVLTGQPHLTAHECTACGARYFDRRNACAACEADTFQTVDVPTEGELRAFTIVSYAAPGIPVPFVAGVVDCGGTSVRANVVNVPADPERVRVGMKLRLTTVPLGTDAAGTEAVGFGFEPAG
ncbi:OB-fold domain-containing protein [Frankia sp. AgPm24]|uniref:Zn-ribbon domain-containing OB-fold protein n=1 Tax=Frankia sp. AgPm24 TaxID=631128 RepID=UPI00200BC9C6|nr:OB-fold domain-containing protein [Frankia sp. AgPm24]MCK9923771.1 OB-fold domain-containing protein [Frankia sp. AgPm24]